MKQETPAVRSESPGFSRGEEVKQDGSLEQGLLKVLGV